MFTIWVWVETATGEMAGAAVNVTGLVAAQILWDTLKANPKIEMRSARP